MGGMFQGENCLNKKGGVRGGKGGSGNKKPGGGGCAVTARYNFLGLKIVLMPLQMYNLYVFVVSENLE